MSAQPFVSHIQELQRRLLVSVSIVLLVAGISYMFRDQIIQFLVAPLHQSLIYTAPSGGFQFLVAVCLGVGVVAALPVFIYNLARFIEPAFERRRTSKKGIMGVLTASFGLATLGLAFAYYLVLPMSFRFFASFTTGPIKPLISTSEYLSFVLGCLITFALIFQLPLLLLFINFINRFPPGSLTRYRRHVIIGSLGLALVLPFTYDPLTQFVVAVPVIALYEISLLSIWAINRNRVSSSPATEPSANSESPATPFMPAAGTVLTPPVSAAAPSFQLDRRRPVQLG